jgi:hypothetical protein
VLFVCYLFSAVVCCLLLSCVVCGCCLQSPACIISPLPSSAVHCCHVLLPAVFFCHLLFAAHCCLLSVVVCFLHSSPLICCLLWSPVCRLLSSAITCCLPLSVHCMLSPTIWHHLPCAVIYYLLLSTVYCHPPSAGGTVVVTSLWLWLLWRTCYLSTDSVYVNFVRYKLKVPLHWHVCNFVDIQTIFHTHFCLPHAYLLVLSEIISSTLKMEAICSSETSVATQETTRRHIPEDATLHNHCCENLKSYNISYTVCRYDYGVSPHLISHSELLWFISYYCKKIKKT